MAPVDTASFPGVIPLSSNDGVNPVSNSPSTQWTETLFGTQSETWSINERTCSVGYVPNNGCQNFTSPLLTGTQPRDTSWIPFSGRFAQPK